MLRFATLALFCLAAPAPAQTPDCSNTSVQMELNLCAEQDWQAEDAELNRAYTSAMVEMKALDQTLPPELQGAVAARRYAQRARITYRDTNCRLAGYPMRGGSAEPLLIYGCPAQMTLDRTAELKALVAY